jgi:phospholipid-binding lipoprotein MlaA
MRRPEPWLSRRLAAASLGLAAVILAGCATTPAAPPADPDPFESFNRDVYAFNDALDRALFGPVARAYLRHVPEPARRGVGNFFTNLTGPNVVLNDVLQGKFRQAFEDTMRFVFNSTFGVGGLMDVASAKGLVRHEEDFGQTLAVWGIPQGPFLMIPVLGPFTTRALHGAAMSYFTYPLFWVDDVRITAPLAALGFIDVRAGAEAALRVVEETALDPYVFVRNAYLQRRNFLIWDGNPPVEDLLDDLDDIDAEEAGAAGVGAPAP